MLFSPFCLNLSYLSRNWSGSCNPVLTSIGTFMHTVFDSFSGNTVKHAMLGDIVVGTANHVILDYSVVCIYIPAFINKKVTICILCIHTYSEPLFMINKVRARYTRVIIRWYSQGPLCQSYYKMKQNTAPHLRSLNIYQSLHHHQKAFQKHHHPSVSLLRTSHFFAWTCHIYVYCSDVTLTTCESISPYVYPVLHTIHCNKMSHLMYCNLDGNIIYLKKNRNNSQLSKQYTCSHAGNSGIIK